MSSKRQTDWVEMVHDAATGYAVVVLAVVCFLIVLAIVIAGVRIVAGTGAAANATAAANSMQNVARSGTA